MTKIRPFPTRAHLLATVATTSLVLAGLVGCNQSIPPTSVPDPLELNADTATIQMAASGMLSGQLDDTAAHTSPDIDPNYLVLQPISVVLRVPVVSATLKNATTTPATLTLTAVHATLTLADPSSIVPLQLAMVGEPATWNLTYSGSGAGYQPAAGTDLTVSLTDVNAVSEFVGLLTSGGDNTAQIRLYADTTDPVFGTPSSPGAKLQLAFGAGSAVFGY